MNLRLNGEELELLRTAAALSGLTPSGLATRAALDVAAGRVRPVPSVPVEAMEALSEARVALNRYGNLLNQAVAKWHSTGEIPGEVMPLLGRTGAIAERLDRAALGLVAAYGASAAAGARVRQRVAQERRWAEEQAAGGAVEAAAGASDHGAGGGAGGDVPGGADADVWDGVEVGP